MLSNDKVGAGFVESIMKIYNKIEVKAEIKIQEIAEIISDLRDPLQNQKGLLQTQQVLSRIQWGFEIRTNLDFEWCWVANGPDFK